MRKNFYNYLILFLVFLAGIINHSFAEEVKQIAYSGRVIDYNARPVEEATVACYRYLDKAPLGRVQTTSDGRFLLQVETEDSQPFLVVHKEGLALGWKVTNRAGENIIRLGKPSIFKGIVVDETGRAVPDARVRICLKNEIMARDDIAPLVPEDWFTTKTNTRGEFIFNNIPQGATADFGVEAQGRAFVWTICDFGPREGEQFAAGNTDIRIILPREARIYGQVVDEQKSQAVAGISVEAIPSNGRIGWFFPNDPVQTDPNGRFVLTGLAPDKYLLQVKSDTSIKGNLAITVKTGQSVRDVKITLSKGIPFEVVVYDSKNESPVKDADVTIRQKDPISRYITFNQKVTTDIDGRARFSLPPGEYEVQVYKLDYGTTMVERNSIIIDPRKKSRQEVFLRHTACILTGEVLNEQGHVLPGTTAVYLSFAIPFFTNANGQFEHIGLHSSRYPSKVSVLARHESSGMAATAELFDPNKPSRFYGRIILKPAYELTGRVIDPKGKSVPAAYVKLLRGVNRQLITEVLSDTEGNFSICSVPPLPDDPKDSYVIISCGEGFGITQVIQIPFHDDTANPVQIEPIVLLPADQTISGMVQDSNNQPVAGAFVEVYGPKLSQNVGQPPCARILTDKHGRFHITGLCKEPLQIEAISPPPQQQSGETWAYGGSENVKVVLGQKLIFSPSLIGKPLPDLKDLKIDLPPANIEDKIILVCFFDMEQRPSRNCIIQLAKRAKELKAKDVIVVAVQASKIDDNKLNDWIKRYNIPFPVGMVEGNEEKIRFTWGVRSLPWLILTNSKHIIRAEGFALTELNDKIGAVSQN